MWVKYLFGLAIENPELFHALTARATCDLQTTTHADSLSRPRMLSQQVLYHKGEALQALGVKLRDHKFDNASMLTMLMLMAIDVCGLPAQATLANLAHRPGTKILKHSLPIVKVSFG